MVFSHRGEGRSRPRSVRSSGTYPMPASRRARVPQAVICSSPPHDGDGVRNLENLVQLVGDEDDGDALLLQLSEVSEELPYFLWNQDRGGFVQDQDPRPPIEHLDDLHSLSFAHRQILDQAI